VGRVDDDGRPAAQDFDSTGPMKLPQARGDGGVRNFPALHLESLDGDCRQGQVAGLMFAH
jgi:hypothetical protein